MARETAEKANRAAIQRESDLVSASIGASAAYLGTMQNNHLLLTCDRDLVAQFGASHRATDARGDLRGDLRWLDRDHGDKMAARRFRQPAAAKFTNVVNNVKGFLEIQEEEKNNWTSAVERRIEDCAGFESGTDANLSSSLGRYYACDDVTMFTYLWFKKQKILNTISMSAGAATEVEKIGALYEAYASYLYGNTSSDFRNESRFLTCLETLNSSSVLWMNRLAGLTGRMRAYVASATTWKQKLEIVRRVEVFYNWTLQNDSLLTDDWFSGCAWPGQCQGQGPDDDDDDSDASYERFESYSQATSESFVELNDLRTALEFTSTQTLGLVEGGLGSIIRILESFQNGSLSKTELYANLTSLDFEVFFNRMRVANEKYVADYNEMISNLLFLQNNIRSAYFYAFRLCQPVMNDSSIARLNLTAYARDILRDTSGSSPSDVEDLLDSLATDREPAFLLLLTAVYRGYRRAMEALQARAQLSFKLLQKALVELTDDLKESFRSSQLNDNFIMQVFFRVLFHRICMRGWGWGRYGVVGSVEVRIFRPPQNRFSQMYVALRFSGRAY